MVGSSLGCKYYTRVELKATLKLQIDTSKITTVKVLLVQALTKRCSTMVGSSLGCNYYTRVELKATLKLQVDMSKITTVKVL
jgi:hypothetical protein